MEKDNEPNEEDNTLIDASQRFPLAPIRPEFDWFHVDTAINGFVRARDMLVEAHLSLDEDKAVAAYHLFEGLMEQLKLGIQPGLPVSTPPESFRNTQ